MFKFFFDNPKNIILKNTETMFLNSLINYKSILKNTICLIPLNITNVSSNETIALIILLFGGIISYAYSRKIKENLPEPQKQKTENTDVVQAMNEIYNGTLTSEELQYYFFTYLSIFCLSTFSIYLIYLYYSSNTNSDDSFVDSSNHYSEQIEQYNKLSTNSHERTVPKLDSILEKMKVPKVDLIREQIVPPVEPILPKKINFSSLESIPAKINLSKSYSMRKPQVIYDIDFETSSFNYSKYEKPLESYQSFCKSFSETNIKLIDSHYFSVAKDLFAQTLAHIKSYTKMIKKNPATEAYYSGILEQFKTSTKQLVHNDPATESILLKHYIKTQLNQRPSNTRLYDPLETHDMYLEILNLNLDLSIFFIKFLQNFELEMYNTFF